MALQQRTLQKRRTYRIADDCKEYCSITVNVMGIKFYPSASLVPRPSWGGGEGLVRTVCACALISRHSGNSVLRTDNSVFKRHYRILSGLSLGSLREREYNQYTSAEKRSHSLSSVFTTCLWNTGKSTLSRVLSPDPKLDGSLPDLTEGFYRFYSH